MYIDYSKINVLTLPDGYLLPRANDIMDRVSDTTYARLLDRLCGSSERVSDFQRIDLPTNLGIISGRQEFTQSPNSRPFYAFRGIPYAEAPLGLLRWDTPRELEGMWPGGQLDATHHRSFCPQYDHETHQVVGSEDCLYLNVYTPSLPGNSLERIPVLFGILCTTLSHRIAPYATGLREDLVMLDQCSPHLSYTFHQPWSLFSGAIMMSGAGNCLWSVADYPEYAAYDLARDLDCTTRSSFALKECLHHKTAQEIILAQTNRHRYVFWPMMYRPVVDGGLRDLPFLPEPVDVLMSRPPATPVPLLLGGVPEEGILYALTVVIFSESRGGPSQLFEEAARYTVESLWPNASTTSSVTDSIISFYYTQHARDDINTLAEEMSEMFTDLLFTSCIWDAADYFASTSRMPVYTYLMTHRDANSPTYAAPLHQLADGRGIKSRAIYSGISHGDDLALLFSLPFNLGQPGPRDLQISALLTFMWATFMYTGSPQRTDVSRNGISAWLPVVPGEPVSYYRISFNPGMSSTPFRSKERNLWRQTLTYLDNVSETSNAYFASTWVLLVLVLLLVMAVLVVGACVWKMRRKDKYPQGSLTLRSRISRNPSPASSRNE
ncbi:carboxylic ester hydrolase-like [Cherax quadricarinatus]|uniref:carboxylic ester hydrolase-like n=1 Tax=Cherax quadricarinatus TaxID=27406 RepID=UPI00387E9DA0